MLSISEKSNGVSKTSFKSAINLINKGDQLTQLPQKMGYRILIVCF